MTLLDLPHGKTQINESQKFNGNVEEYKRKASHLLAGNSGTCKEEGCAKSANEKYKEGGGGVTRDPWGEETHL